MLSSSLVRSGVRISRTLAAAALLGLLVVFLVPVTPADASAPLRQHAASRGKFIGTALATGPLSSETSYRNIAATEFSQVTAENAMKWESTEPNQGQFTFSGADAIVDFAAQNGQQVHGHTLVWHNQTPGWVQGLGAGAMRTAMQDHIGQVVGRYADNPTVVSWDVVNEVFDDNGDMRGSVLVQHARAELHRRRLPLRPRRRPRRAAVHQRLQRRRHQRQEHRHVQPGPVTAGSRTCRSTASASRATWPSSTASRSDLQQNLQRFADLGVQVRITEVDIRMQMPASSSKDATQATYYRNVVNACLASPPAPASPSGASPTSTPGCPTPSAARAPP